MATLETLQQYADQCADKLGIPEKPKLRWHTKDSLCPMGTSVIAHCHTNKNGIKVTAPRGTICLNKRKSVWRKVGWWHNTIAHEVTHLAIKSSHSSTTFARRMVQLGVANSHEKRLERSSRRHKHTYRNGICSLCGKPDMRR